MLLKINPSLTPRPEHEISAAAADQDTSKFSGAQVAPKAGDSNFNTVSASWIIPNLHPHEVGKGGSIATWVGLDGILSKSNSTIAGSVVKVGTRSTLTVSSSGSTVSTYFWFQVRQSDSDGTDVKVRFPLATGDVVTCTVCWDPVNNEDFPGSATFSVLGSGHPAMTFDFTFYDTALTAIEGTNAEWILEDISTSSDVFPDYGSTFIYDEVAERVVGTTISETTDLSNAGLLNMVGTTTASGSTPKSTAVKENKEVLLLYAYNNKPRYLS